MGFRVSSAFSLGWFGMPEVRDVLLQQYFIFRPAAGEPVTVDESLFEDLDDLDLDDEDSDEDPDWQP